MEIYKKHRPQTPKDLFGQKEAVDVLKGLGQSGRMPHAMLFSGPSGVGKTTIARMVARMLKCGAGDLQEINAAQIVGIDFIRTLQQQAQMYPIAGEARVWILDECHKLSAAAQDGLLKLLEDPPSHAYFFLCTTDQQKLKKTIVTRCTEIKLRLLTDDHIRALLNKVSAEEEPVTEAVIDKIVTIAGGSARKALVMYEQVMGIPSEADQISALDMADSSVISEDLAKQLLAGKDFGTICQILKQLKD